MMEAFLVEAITLSSVRENPENFNVCNSWAEKGLPPPDDYSDILAATETRHWISYFHPESTYHELTIYGSYQLGLLCECSRAGKITGRVPGHLAEDLREAARQLEKGFPRNPAEGFFVRTEHVSLKTGMHGVGPYSDILSILESMVTCTHRHTPVRDPVSPITLYLLPWREDMQGDDAREFRVFVFEGEITAVSQQHWYEPEPKALGLGFEILALQWVQTILDYFKDHIKPKLDLGVKLSSYVMDVALMQGEPYFIEVNPFGGEYSSGSSLFHWERDHDKLRDSSVVEFRYLQGD